MTYNVFGGTLKLAQLSSTQRRAATNLCRLVTEAHGSEQLAQGCYPISPRKGIELTTTES